MGENKPVKLYVQGDRLFADVTVSAGVGQPSIEIRRNEFTVRVPGWDKNSDQQALEIVNAQHQPVFQMIYLNNFHVQVNGFLTFPGGMVVGHNGGMTSNPSPPFEFQIDRIFKYPSAQHPGERETH